MKPYKLLQEMKNSPEIQKMKQYEQHRNTNSYTHCLHVTLKSLWIIRRMGLKLDEQSVIRGAMLHDYYLYDIEEEKLTPWQHGRRHPEIALKNAEKLFKLNQKEKNIIYSHMWPLHFTHIPKCREAVVISIADKICAVEERYFWKRRSIGTDRKF